MNRSRHLGGLYARPASEPFEPVERWERPRLLAELKRLGERIEDLAAPSLAGFAVDHSAELARLRKDRDRALRALRRHDRSRINANAGPVEAGTCVGGSDALPSRTPVADRIDPDLQDQAIVTGGGLGGCDQPSPCGSPADHRITSEPGLALPPGDPMAAKALPAALPAPAGMAPLWLGEAEQRRIRRAQASAEPDWAPRLIALRFGFTAEYSLETGTAGTWRKLTLSHQQRRPDLVQLGAVMREFGFRDRLSEHTLWYGRRSKGGGSITVVEWIAASAPPPDEEFADPEPEAEEC